MKRVLVAFLLLLLLIMSLGSVGTGSTPRFEMSLNSSSVEVTGDVNEVLLVIKDAHVSTRYLSSNKPVSINLSVINRETSKTVDRNYRYDIGDNRKFTFNKLSSYVSLVQAISPKIRIRN